MNDPDSSQIANLKKDLVELNQRLVERTAAHLKAFQRVQDELREARSEVKRLKAKMDFHDVLRDRFKQMIEVSDKLRCFILREGSEGIPDDILELLDRTRGWY